MRLDYFNLCNAQYYNTAMMLARALYTYMAQQYAGWARSPTGKSLPQTCVANGNKVYLPKQDWSCTRTSVIAHLLWFRPGSILLPVVNLSLPQPNCYQLEFQSFKAEYSAWHQVTWKPRPTDFERCCSCPVQAVDEVRVQS